MTILYRHGYTWSVSSVDVIRFFNDLLFLRTASVVSVVFFRFVLSVNGTPVNSRRISPPGPVRSAILPSSGKKLFYLTISALTPKIRIRSDRYVRLERVRRKIKEQFRQSSGAVTVFRGAFYFFPLKNVWSSNGCNVSRQMILLICPPTYLILK